MKEWRECLLGEAVTFQRGFDITQAQQVSGKYPVVSSSGINSFHHEWKVSAPGVVIGRKGTLGTVFYLDREFWPHDTTLWIKNFGTNDAKFIYYFIFSLELQNYDVGSSNPTLNRNHIHLLPIIIPDLHEQKAIASVLSSLDDKIDLLHRQNVTLESMAEALFRQWFVVEAKEEWEEKCIGDIFDIKGGTTPKTNVAEYWDGDIYWTSPRDLSTAQSTFMFKTGRRITQKGLLQISSGLLPVGTLLLSSRAPIGYLAITCINVAINQGYIAIMPESILGNYYMYLWCKHNMEEIKCAANGSVFQEISKSNFRKLPFILPSKEHCNAFNKIIQPFFERISSNQTQIHTLEKLRDALLPKLMSGEVRVGC
jgi:type I restriction enzyme S subunit